MTSPQTRQRRPPTKRAKQAELPRSRSTWWQAAIAVPAALVAIFVRLWLQGPIVSDQLAHCPARSFVSGSTSLAEGLVFLPAMAALGMLGYTGMAAIVGLLPSDGAQAAARGYADSLGQSLRSKLAWLGAVVAIGIPLTATFLHAGVCAWPGGVSERTTSFSTPVVHAWSDVTILVASCSRGSKGRIITTLQLIFREGPVVDVPLDQPLSAIWESLGLALRGVPFTYVNAAIADCRDATRAVFAHAPGEG